MKHEENYRIKFDFKKWMSRLSIEMKRAIDLSKKMIHAGQTSVELKDALGELGLYIYKKKDCKLNLEDQELKKLISKVEYLEKVMHQHEESIHQSKNLKHVNSKIVSETT